MEAHCGHVRKRSGSQYNQKKREAFLFCLEEKVEKTLRLMRAGGVADILLMSSSAAAPPVLASEGPPRCTASGRPPPGMYHDQNTTGITQASIIIDV